MSRHGKFIETDFIIRIAESLPRWETSREGAELLLSYGIEYDHSMSHHDCQPYYLRTGDSWTKIDYSKKAEEWMKPLVAGQDTGLVEIPANWYLDVSSVKTIKSLRLTNYTGFATTHVHQSLTQQSRLRECERYGRPVAGSL